MSKSQRRKWKRSRRKCQKEGLNHDVNVRTPRSCWIGWRPAEMGLTSWMRMWPQSWISSALTSSTLQIIRQVSKCKIQHKMSSTQCGVRCFYPWLLSTEEKVLSIKTENSCLAMDLSFLFGNTRILKLPKIEMQSSAKIDRLRKG